MQKHTSMSQRPGYPTTLFQHYKNMINLLWNDGHRTYTAQELNSFVGRHEKITVWKRINNNPYYSTRCYQTELKHLGCITPIKRGLWKINAPIPEWFGSFHINGLKGRLGEDCIYWNELLPAEHKVNPWKQKPAGSADKQVTLRRGESITAPTVEELSFVSVCDIVVPVDAIPGCKFTADVQVIGYDVEVVDWNITVNGISINNAQFESLLGIYVPTFRVDAVIENLKAAAKTAGVQHYDKIFAQKLSDKKAAAETAASKEHLYTADQVMEMFIGFAEKLQASVIADIEDAVDNLDADDIVDLELEQDHSISVDLNSRAITNALNDTILDTFNIMRDEMQESFPSMNSKS
jgi:hypothetical protein